MSCQDYDPVAKSKLLIAVEGLPLVFGDPEKELELLAGDVRGVYLGRRNVVLGVTPCSFLGNGAVGAMWDSDPMQVGRAYVEGCRLIKGIVERNDFPEVFLVQGYVEHIVVYEGLKLRDPVAKKSLFERLFQHAYQEIGLPRTDTVVDVKWLPASLERESYGQLQAACPGLQVVKVEFKDGDSLRGHCIRKQVFEAVLGCIDDQLGLD